MLNFLLPKLAEMLLRPSMLLLLCVLLAAAAGRRGAALAAAAALLLAAVLPLGEWAARPLEDRFARPSLPARVDGLLVLGGAVEEDIYADRGIPSVNGAAERMTEAVALARRFPEARVVFSGGSGRIIHERVTEADVARAFWRPLGLGGERVTFEAASRTTAENARLTTSLIAPARGSTWLLITSAMHMPRAFATFCAAGWPVLPWPTAYTTLPRRWRWLEPPGARLAELDAATHEWAGLVIYRLLGQTRQLLPDTGRCTP